jgi:hypothetical protein
VLIDSFAPQSDAAELHRIEIAAPADAVYRALWSTDLGGSPVIKTLMGLRSLPEFVLHPKRPLHRSQKISLQTLIDSGFGKLAEAPGREVVLGIAGRFWRPTGNIFPFEESDFSGPVPEGQARAVWNFAVQQTGERTLLSTETRVICGDRASRLKFRTYWLIVRPFSGLIRRVMLQAVRCECEGIRSTTQR